MDKRYEALINQIAEDMKAYNVNTRLNDEQGRKALQQDLLMMLDKWVYKYGIELEPMKIRQISRTQFNVDIMSAFRKFPRIMQEIIACEMTGIDMDDVASFDYCDENYIVAINFKQNESALVRERFKENPYV